MSEFGSAYVHSLELVSLEARPSGGLLLDDVISNEGSSLDHLLRE